MQVPFRHESPDARPVIRWPQGERLAVWVIPNVEYFRLDGPVPGVSDQVPNIPAFAARDYGGRVGFWRIVEALDEFGVAATVAMNSDVCQAYPDVTERIVSAGWEIMGHNQSNSERLVGLADDAERDLIQGTLDTIEAATGQRPRGWLSSGLQEGYSTLSNLAGAGIDYVCDWVNDDAPYAFDAPGAPSIVSVPYTLEINDKPVIERHGHSAEEFATRAMRQFDVLYREGARSGKVMAIAIHPYLIGQPHRIDALREILAYVTGHAGVWMTTGGAIADHYRATQGAGPAGRPGAAGAGSVSAEQQ